MFTPTPTRDIVSRGLRCFLQGLTAAGWDVEAPGVTAPGEVAYCLVARSPVAKDGARARSHLIYVYEGLRDVAVEDLWRLVSDTRLAGADAAIMCLGGHVVLTPEARKTAAMLQIRVLRLQS